MSKRKRKPKRKGKSERRIKDWHGRYRAGEDADAKAQQGRRYVERAVKLPPSRLAAPEEDQEDLPKKQGLVVAVYQRGAVVRIDGEEAFCAIAKTFRAPPGSTALTVGDVVTVAATQDRHVDGRVDIDGDRTEGMILTRRPREAALSRPRPTSAKRMNRYGADAFEQVIAANMDLLLVVASTRQPKLRPRLIERFLIVAERGELEPLLAINKIDLKPPEPRVMDGFRELGMDVVPCSAVSGEGLDALRRRLAGRRTVLAGASGVGKSTLVNALVPTAEAATRAVRMKDQRGRHTTAAATVYDLPPIEPAEAAGAEPPAPDGLPGEPLVGVGPGGVLVDTPGVRELSFAFELEELPWYFPEFEPFVLDCRFNDCTHTHEPGCAVLAAVEAGKVAARRYESYLRIRESLTEEV